MKNALLLSCFLLAGLLAIGQNTRVVNDKNAEKRSVQGFHGIYVSGGIDLYLNQGAEDAVAVSASDPEHRAKIVTEVIDGILHIHPDDQGFHWNWHGNGKLRAYVSCKAMDELRAWGGSDVYIDDPVKGDRLVMYLSGGSDLHGKVNFGELTVSQSGGSDSYIGGTASRLHVHTSGGSDFHGYDLVTDDCQAEASGGSDIYVTVNKELDAVSSGGSDIHHKGNGSIRQRG